MIMTIHTFGEYMGYNCHLHALVADGLFSPSGMFYVAPEKFSLPRINGSPVDLRPEAVYDSPYLKGKFGSDKINVTVGPFNTVYDFANGKVTRTVQ